MLLPQEVIDNIVFSLLTPVYQSENQAASTQWIDGRVFKTNTCRDKLGIGHRMAFDLETVCNMRLVSLTWYRSATKLLEKHNSWRLDLDSEYFLAKARQLCTDEVGIGRLLPTRNIVRRLKIPPIMASMAPRPIRYKSLDRRPNAKELLQWPKDSAVSYRRFMVACVADVNEEEARERSRDMTVVYTTLHGLLKSLAHIESFDMAFPEATWIWDNHSAESHIFDVVQGLSLEIEYAFRTEAFTYLQDLRVSLPGTYHIRGYLSGMSQAARDRLKNLFIGITDATGAAGCHEYFAKSYYEVQDGDGTVHDSRETVLRTPPSPLQLHKPNRRYQDNLWEFIASCHNLTSLGVKATHYLDLRNLTRESYSRLNGLSELYLSRVYVDEKSVLNLLLPGNWDKTTPARLQNLTLEDVKMHLDGGTWSQVMQFLWDHCANLDHLSLSMLSYFDEHPRAWRLYERSFKFKKVIATTSEEDVDSVCRIVDRFLERERGIVNCPEVYYSMAIGLGYDEFDCKWTNG